MNGKDENPTKKSAISRRGFLGVGGAALAGSAVPLVGARAEEEDETPRIKRYRTLGRTGFAVSACPT